MKTRLLVLVLIFLTGTTLAHQVEYLHAPAHLHGVGDLTLAWQHTDTGTRLTVTAIYPGHDVVGFEHLPQNAREKRALRDAYEMLTNHPAITTAACKLLQANISSALFDEHANQYDARSADESDSFFNNLFDDSKQTAGEAGNAPEHMDFSAVYTFMCRFANEPLTFSHFTLFADLKQIRVHKNDVNTAITHTLSPGETRIRE